MVALFRRAILWVILVCGALEHWMTGRTPKRAYHAMVALFCATGGKSNDAISKWISLSRRRYDFSMAQSPVAALDNGFNRAAVLEALDARGYHVFAQRLSADACGHLLDFALSTPCLARRMDNGSHAFEEKQPYDRQSSTAVRYDFLLQDLLSNAEVQLLLADDFFPAIAQDYLRAPPILDIVAMWWHTSHSEQPDSEAAQFFHFDMDRPKWLKFFIYLTDVAPENGPHTFVAGSQRTGGIPEHLLKKGYARISDGEVSQSYDVRDVIEFAAPAGTIIAEDTRGLHKGKNVQHGDRLVLQLEFCNSLFGGSISRVAEPEVMAPEMRNRVRKRRPMFAVIS
jgi:hypothetical protein